MTPGGTAAKGKRWARKSVTHLMWSSQLPQHFWYQLLGVLSRMSANIPRTNLEIGLKLLTRPSDGRNCDREHSTNYTGFRRRPRRGRGTSNIGPTKQYHQASACQDVANGNVKSTVQLCGNCGTDADSRHVPGMIGANCGRVRICPLT